MTDKELKKRIRWHKFVEWWRRWSYYLLIIVSGLLAIGLCVRIILFATYHVEYLEYVNADFEWVDDFGNYEVVICHEEQCYYLTIKDYKVKFIYANEDFLNFVVVEHEKRVVDSKDYFSVKAFYINLCYKEMEL